MRCCRLSARKIDGFLDGEGIDGWVDEWRGLMDGLMDGWVGEIDEWVNGEGGIDGWMGRRN